MRWWSAERRCPCYLSAALTTLLWIILATLVSGVLSVLAAGVFLALPSRAREAALPRLVGFATGALLGAALLALIPHAVEGAGMENVHEVGIALIAGIALFFISRSSCSGVIAMTTTAASIRWTRRTPRPHRSQPRRARSRPGPQEGQWLALVLVGDALHNVLDGVLIAAAFLTDVHLGIVTAVAIMAHEIRRKSATSPVLLHSGVSRRRALLLNLLTSLTAVIGGVIGFFALEQSLEPCRLRWRSRRPVFICGGGGPDTGSAPQDRPRRSSVTQVVLIGLGIALITFAEAQAH